MVTVYPYFCYCHLRGRYNFSPIESDTATSQQPRKHYSGIKYDKRKRLVILTKWIQDFLEHPELYRKKK